MSDEARDANREAARRYDTQFTPRIIIDILKPLMRREDLLTFVSQEIILK